MRCLFQILLCLIALAAPVAAQDLSGSDRAALTRMMDFAKAELLRGTTVEEAAPRENAIENRKHILRMIETIERNGRLLARSGVSSDIAATGILFSDLGKNAEYLDAHARKVFPALYAENPGLAKFKAFLIHEEPGIEKVRELARREGLSEAATKAVVKAIVGHNGPGVEGSWWKENWDKLIKNHEGPANSELVGKSYPKTPSPAGAVHTILDRVDQGGLSRSPTGWEGGPKKIHNDIRGTLGFEEAITEALEGNPRKTLLQLDALKASHPKLFELPFVASGVKNLHRTRALLNNIEFITEASGERVARIHSLSSEGEPRAKIVRGYEDFWSELNRIEEPLPAKAWSPEGKRLLRERGKVLRNRLAAHELVIDAEAKELRALARGRFSEADLSRIDEALRFARESHRGQVRDGGEPFTTHPLRVARALLRSGRPVTVEAINAALLHDVVEDTRVPLSRIRARFGERVAVIVDGLTLPEISEHGGDKEARDKAYYEGLRKAPRAVHRIKLADRLDNIRDMRGWSVDGRLGYLDSTERTVVAALKERSPELAKTLSNEVARLRSEIATEVRAQESGRLLDRFRRADGSVKWRDASASGALKFGTGAAHFALALFLKEMAVVVQTGDRLRIEEFFDMLATTDFFVTYGLFAAGASGANLFYGRYVEKYIKPRFVSGVMRTSLVLATGMALPEIVRGQLDGKAFAINLGSLGLSTAAVKAGLRGITWVVDLKRAERMGRLARAGASMQRLARFGGWLFSAAETAVVLYLGDEINDAVTNYLDERAARTAVADATDKLFNALADPKADFDRLLEDFDTTHGAYRNHLYRPLTEDEGRYLARLQRASTKAKRISDRAAAMADSLRQNPALAAAYEKRFGSTDKYIESRLNKDNAALDQLVNESLRIYQRDRSKHLTAIYQSNRRASPYLHGVPSPKTGDPYKARSDFLARLGRRAFRRELHDAAYEISENRIQAYDDELAAPALAGRASDQDSDRGRKIAALITRIREIKRRDQALVAETRVSSEGITGAVERGGR